MYTCDCGYTSCGGGRGCGDCADCYGEHCECFLIERFDDPELTDILPISKLPAGYVVSEPLTCDDCVGYCAYRGDAYNKHGDCLAEK
jgi:hypothetical protein